MGTEKEVLMVLLGTKGQNEKLYLSICVCIHVNVGICISKCIWTCFAWIPGLTPSYHSGIGLNVISSVRLYPTISSKGAPPPPLILHDIAPIMFLKVFITF